ncbi:MAG TPA: carboxypeptidase regulatory-like domain-containing protein, partial [Pyrinomonadaceae bacterium]|nr:carboxypeptidase regulatory-like domain-containing protein [Pyrinomonadaceae bacterium]
SRVPQIISNGRVGSGAATPQIKAISPPLVGNPNFTVSVSSALGNASAVLVIDAVDPGVGSAIPSSGSFARIATNTQNTGAGNGWASVSVAIPDSSAVAGHTFFARWYVQDPAAVNGFSVSQAAQFTVFGQASTAGANISVSGRVLAPDGRALRNTAVTLTDALGGIHRVTTSSFGIYTIDDISTAGNCTIAVSSRLYRFAPQTFSLSGDLTNVDFVGLE